MLNSVKNKITKTALINLLSFIVEGTKSAAGFAYVPLDEATKLHKAEPTFVTIDKGVTNDKGQVKAVASQVAIDALAAGASADTEESAPAASVEPMKYGFHKLEKIPDINRGGNKTESYPFGELAVFPVEPHAFMVPATEGRPNPAKALASTVASANKRSFPAPATKRTFTVRKHVVEGKVVGALVIRTA